MFPLLNKEITKRDKLNIQCKEISRQSGVNKYLVFRMFYSSQEQKICNTQSRTQINDQRRTTRFYVSEKKSQFCPHMKSFEQFKTDLILIDQSEYTCNDTILLPLFQISNPLYIVIRTHTRGIQTIQLQLHITNYKTTCITSKSKCTRRLLQKPQLQRGCIRRQILFLVV